MASAGAVLAAHVGPGLLAVVVSGATGGTVAVDDELDPSSAPAHD